MKKNKNKIKLNDVTYCSDGHNIQAFLVTITRDAKLVPYDNSKHKRQVLSLDESWSTAKLIYIQKRWFCMFGTEFMELSILECWNLDKLWMQIFSVNNMLSKSIFNWKVSDDCQKALFFNIIMQDSTTHDKPWKKN